MKPFGMKIVAEWKSFKVCQSVSERCEVMNEVIEMIKKTVISFEKGELYFPGVHVDCSLRLLKRGRLYMMQDISIVLHFWSQNIQKPEAWI